MTLVRSGKTRGYLCQPYESPFLVHTFPQPAFELITFSFILEPHYDGMMFYS